MITEGLFLNILSAIGFASVGIILSFVARKKMNVIVPPTSI